MNTKKIFCEVCRNDVNYVEASVPMIGTIKEKEYHYIGIEARCADCGSLLFIPELSDLNLRALYDVYRKENGIIPLEQIREIPEKYSIGKRPLSLLLGWGNRLSPAMPMAICLQNNILIFLYAYTAILRSIPNYWKRIKGT